MVYYDSSYLRIVWDESVDCVIMDWKGFVGGERFRSGLLKGLELLVDKNATRWLAVLTEMGSLLKEDQEWSNSEWFPRAAEAGVQKIAIIVPQKVLAQMSVNAIMQKAARSTIESKHFKNIEEAKSWLAEP